MTKHVHTSGKDQLADTDEGPPCLFNFAEQMNAQSPPRLPAIPEWLGKYILVARTSPFANMWWSEQVCLQQRKGADSAARYILILAALAPGALRYALVVIRWLVAKVRKLGVGLFSLAPLVGSIMRILGVWLARSLRKVAAWGNKEVVDARPRTRIL